MGMAVWDNFLEYLKDQKRYSPHTLRAYQNDLKGFFSFLHEQYSITQPEEVDRELVRSYIVYLLDQKLSRRSIHRKLSSLKSYYSWLRKFHGLKIQPAEGISLPKLKQDLPVFVTREAMQDLVQLLPQPTDYNAARDAAILLLLYGSGMRVSELCGLKILDVSLSQQVIRVLGKRNKERDIPLGNLMAEMLEAYMEWRNAQTNYSDALFLTNRGKPVYPRWVYTLVKNWLGLVTTQQKRSPHILRHSFATHMLNAGADLNAIKEILGHASLAATQVYTHNTIEKLRNVYQQAHPRA